MSSLVCSNPWLSFCISIFLDLSLLTFCLWRVADFVLQKLCKAQTNKHVTGLCFEYRWWSLPQKVWSWYIMIMFNTYGSFHCPTVCTADNLFLLYLNAWWWSLVVSRSSTILSCMSFRVYGDHTTCWCHQLEDPQARQTCFWVLT